MKSTLTRTGTHSSVVRFSKRDDGTILQTIERPDGTGTDLVRTGFSVEEAAQARDRLDALLTPVPPLPPPPPPPPPPPSPSDLRPWINQIQPTSSHHGGTLEGRLYEDVLFTGQVTPVEGTRLRRCILGGWRGMTGGATLLFASRPVSFDLSFCEIRNSKGRSGVYMGRGHITGEGNWWHHNGVNGQFDHALYWGGGSGSLQGGLIEHSSAFGLHFYSPDSYPEPVHDVTWDGLTVRTSGRSGVIYCERQSNVVLTNLRSTDNGEAGLSEYHCKGLGNRVQGDLSGNPSGAVVRSGSNVVQVTT